MLAIDMRCRSPGYVFYEGTGRGEKGRGVG